MASDLPPMTARELGTALRVLAELHGLPEITISFAPGVVRLSNGALSGSRLDAEHRDLEEAVWLALEAVATTRVAKLEQRRAAIDGEFMSLKVVQDMIARGRR